MKESKTDLATSIGTFILGTVIAFVICSMFLPKIADETYKTIEQAIGSDLDVPDLEVFNINALNPTVEVCVGCSNDQGSEINLEDTDSDNAEDNENNENNEEDNTEGEDK